MASRSLTPTAQFSGLSQLRTPERSWAISLLSNCWFVLLCHERKRKVGKTMVWSTYDRRQHSHYWVQSYELQRMLQYVRSDEELSVRERCAEALRVLIDSCQRCGHEVGVSRLACGCSQCLPTGFGERTFTPQDAVRLLGTSGDYPKAEEN